MPGDPAETGTEEKRIDGVPLYLVPKVIADHIRGKGEQVFRISVCREKEHRYRIVVETFAEHSQRVAETTRALQEQLMQQQKGDGTHG